MDSCLALRGLHGFYSCDGTQPSCSAGVGNRVVGKHTCTAVRQQWNGSWTSCGWMQSRLLSSQKARSLEATVPPDLLTTASSKVAASCCKVTKSPPAREPGLRFREGKNGNGKGGQGTSGMHSAHLCFQRVRVKRRRP